MFSYPSSRPPMPSPMLSPPLSLLPLLLLRRGCYCCCHHGCIEVAVVVLLLPLSQLSSSLLLSRCHRSQLMFRVQTQGTVDVDTPFPLTGSQNRVGLHASP